VTELSALARFQGWETIGDVIEATVQDLCAQAGWWNANLSRAGGSMAVPVIGMGDRLNARDTQWTLMQQASDGFAPDLVPC
jgi:hypothetical protein